MRSGRRCMRAMPPEAERHARTAGQQQIDRGQAAMRAADNDHLWRREPRGAAYRIAAAFGKHLAGEHELATTAASGSGRRWTGQERAAASVPRR